MCVLLLTAACLWMPKINDRCLPQFLPTLFFEMVSLLTLDLTVAAGLVRQQVLEGPTFASPQ